MTEAIRSEFAAHFAALKDVALGDYGSLSNVPLVEFKMRERWSDAPDFRTIVWPRIRIGRGAISAIHNGIVQDSIATMRSLEGRKRGNDGANATMGAVCMLGCRMARSFIELAEPVHAYADWTAANERKVARATSKRIGHYTLAHSLVIARHAGGYDNAHPYVEAIASLDVSGSIDHAYMRAGALETLGWAVIGANTFPDGRNIQTSSLPRAQAVGAFEQYGLLPNSWWLDYGVNAVGIFTIPEFLQTLHTKLGYEDAYTHARGEMVQHMIEAYVGKLLNTYAETAAPNSAIKKAASYIVRPSGAANLVKLAAAAKAYAATVETGGIPADYTDMRDIGSALYEILAQTWPSNPIEREERMMRDLLHVEIIDTLYFRLRRERHEAVEKNLSSLQRQYPEASDATVRVMHDQLEKGLPPVAVGARFSGKRRRGRAVNPWTLKRPGGGLMS